MLGTARKTSECVLNYFEKALRTFRGAQPTTDKGKFNGLHIKGK